MKERNVLENGFNVDVSNGLADELNTTATDKVFSESYANPPILEGYKHVCGEWNNGYVIERNSDGSQFTWIPVGSLDSDGTLDGKTFGEKFGRRDYTLDEYLNQEHFKRTDEFLKEYTGISLQPRDEYSFYNETLENELLQQIESVKKYGGFYISRYNISKGLNGNAQSVNGVLPWVGIGFFDAKKVAANIEDNETVKSHLTFGAEYDSVLAWFIKSRARTLEEIGLDSTNWGNYCITENSPKVLAETGYRKEWCTNNIADFAGNVSEWTQENFKGSSGVARGGDFWCGNGNHNVKGIYPPVAERHYVGTTNYGFSNIGFRAVLYIK